MGIEDMVNALLGRKSVPPESPAFEPAPGLQSYPTRDDAAYAKQYGFGYEKGIEPYVKNEVARVMGADHSYPPKPGDKFIPKAFVPYSATGMTTTEATTPSALSTKNLDLKDPANSKLKEQFEDYYARAALAANRIPIAGLGFDPRNVIADSKMSQGNFAGLYSPERDSTYVNSIDGYPSVPVHEAMHRGIAKLRQTVEGKDLLRKIPADEEYIVRYLMSSQAGDPEEGKGEAGEAQRQMAKRIFGKGLWDKDLQALNDLAAKEVARRKPGGPN